MSKTIGYIPPPTEPTVEPAAEPQAEPKTGKNKKDAGPPGPKGDTGVTR